MRNLRELRMDMQHDSGRRMVSSAVVLLITSVFIMSAYRYDARGAEFPLIIGWVTLMLCVVDLFASLPTQIGGWLSSILHKSRSTPDDKTPASGREAGGILWIGAMVALVWVFGFLIAIPIYSIAFMTLNGRRPLVSSTIAAGITTLFVYVVFEWLLRYELYRGLLFG